jgi:hypothetical protein
LVRAGTDQGKISVHSQFSLTPQNLSMSRIFSAPLPRERGRSRFVFEGNLLGEGLKEIPTLVKEEHQITKQKKSKGRPQTSAQNLKKSFFKLDLLKSQNNTSPQNT